MQQNEELEKKKRREQYDRLTAVSHTKIENFMQHQKFEGYYENADAGHMFKCDRLMKYETMFGRLQMGYNPNRGKSFIFANIKTSRYDTAAGSKSRVMYEYQQKSLLKGQNENRLYVGHHAVNAAVILEKRENKPWTENSIKPYMRGVNLESLKKVMPFLDVQEERKKLDEVHEERRQLQDQVAENIHNGNGNDNINIRHQQLENLYSENALETAIYRKEMQSKLFFRKINYAFDHQKAKMFEYYRNQRRRIEEAEEENTNKDDEDDDET